jgi:hypothetical protein
MDTDSQNQMKLSLKAEMIQKQKLANDQDMNIKGSMLNSTEYDRLFGTQNAHSMESLQAYVQPKVLRTHAHSNRKQHSYRD